MRILRSIKSRFRMYVNQRDVEWLARANNVVLADTPSWIDCLIFKEVFLKRAYATFFPLYRKITILDIGAHKGYFTLFAQRNSDPQSRIISIEPDQRNFRALELNLRANNLSNVITVHAGIAANSGTALLHYSLGTNNSLYEEYCRSFSAESASETIKVFSLCDVLSAHNLEIVDFMKLDCEGAEYESLFACPAEILGRIQTISMEFHDLKQADRSGYAMYHFLRSQGYDIIHYAVEQADMNINAGKLIATRHRAIQ